MVAYAAVDICLKVIMNTSLPVLYGGWAGIIELGRLSKGHTVIYTFENLSTEI